MRKVFRTPPKTYEFAEKEFIDAVKKASRRKQRTRGPRRVVPNNLELPRFMTVPLLSKKLNRTMMDVCKKAATRFDWWPKVTLKTLKKTSYRDVKALVLSYEEAKDLCEVYERESTPLDIKIEPDQQEGHIPVMLPRPSVVSILGHVDHGKTTLMDALRGGSNVALHEPGGITQDTYCFLVNLDGEVPTTFLDTPGHRVFTSMRDNAAFLSDLAVLVVDFNQGLQLQTLESISFAAEHGIPMLPVITKLDEGVLTNRDQTAFDQLATEIKASIVQGTKAFPEYPSAFLENSMIEPTGISARTGWNFDSFKRRVVERLEGGLAMEADVDAQPYGAVIEAFREDPGRGNVMTVVLWQGCLRKGDAFTAGMVMGKIKQITSASDRKIVLDHVPPGVPVQIMGGRGLPQPGDDFIGALEEHQAISLAEERQCEERYHQQPRIRGNESEEQVFGGGKLIDLDRNGDDYDADEQQKGQYDVYDEEKEYEEFFETRLGSSDNPHMVQVIDSGIGPITKADILLANTTGATLQCFRVKPPAKQHKDMLKRLKVEINTFDVYFDFLRNLGLKVR
eukprot:jgi/Bigna1/139199/aug1.49_g13907